MSNNHGDIVIEAPASYKWVEGTLKKITYVAEAGGVKYESLQKAIDAAKSKAVVTMLADTRENVTISKALTLDLNGFTLNGSTGERKAALKVDNATVTVKDSSANQTGTIKREDVEDPNVTGSNSYYVIDIQGGNGLLIFEGGNVTNTSGIVGVKDASLVRLGDDSVSARPTLTINGGTFTQDNFVAIKVDRCTSRAARSTAMLPPSTMIPHPASRPESSSPAAMSPARWAPTRITTVWFRQKKPQWPLLRSPAVRSTKTRRRMSSKVRRLRRTQTARSV